MNYPSAFVYAYFQFGRYFVRYRVSDDKDQPYLVVVHHDDKEIHRCSSDHVTLSGAYYILASALTLERG